MKNKQHPRAGFRKEDAKRSTMSLRVTDDERQMLFEQASQEMVSVSDHIAAMGKAFQQAGTATQDMNEVLRRYKIEIESRPKKKQK